MPLTEWAEGVKSRSGGLSLILASSSEPYVHYYEEGEIRVRRGTGGVVSALEPIARALGGVWIAHGSGDADQEASDEKGRIAVPPENPSYSLRRVLLTKEDDDGFLSGSSNGALWPLSHIAHVRPRFVDSEWEAYKRVNKLFSDAIIEEIRNLAEKPFVWVNDYHLALCAKYVKEKMPDVPCSFFWHIPWPNAERFRICPWHAEMLEAMLSYDLIGFHTNYYASNFMDSVDQTLEARVDKPPSLIHFRGHETAVRALPISVDSRGIGEAAGALSEDTIRKTKAMFGVKKGMMAVGVDRMDYTKGLPEKIKAVGFLLRRHPELVGRFTLVQVASPTRVHIEEYRKLGEEVIGLAEQVNWEFGSKGWKPVELVADYVDQKDILALYRGADMCVVTSLHDGMNLVSKEFVSANPAGKGVLVLSKFAGAARELGDALLVNPYSLSEIADAMHRALMMPAEERKARMLRMKAEVGENDVFKWGRSFIEQLSRVRVANGRA